MTHLIDPANELPTTPSTVVFPLILALGLTACVMDEGQDSLAVQTQEIGLSGLPDNGLPMPGLPDNGLPMPGLPDNGLPMPGLPDNGLGSDEVAQAWGDWLNDPERGALNNILMSYIVRCALDSTQVASYTDASGYTWVWPGEIGVATGWALGSIGSSERRWVTSCVLSLVNKNAQTVQISQRGTLTSPYTDIAPEIAVFSQQEGAFFGDMFAATPTYYSCSASSAPSLRTDGRVCTQTDEWGNSLCDPIQALGTCADVCTPKPLSVKGLSYTVYTNCEGVDGTIYSQVTNTSLALESIDDQD